MRTTASSGFDAGCHDALGRRGDRVHGDGFLGSIWGLTWGDIGGAA